MTLVLDKNFAWVRGTRDAFQEQSARKKMMAAEWGK
jgi:hypothetical protein